MTSNLDKDRLWDTLQSLGEIGETENEAMMRVTGSETDKEARDVLVDWFKKAGMDVSVDPVGNIVARLSGQRDAPPVVTGSHIDTVPEGGKFDGVVGVLGPLEIVRAWNSDGFQPDRPLEIVIFTEEEGTRFDTGLLGSLVASNQLDVDEALALQDKSGQTLEETLESIGYQGTKKFDLADSTAFVEMHVEQGPILDDNDIPIGIVESIAGITHHLITIRGERDHAGNTPMDTRRDAFMGAAEVANAIEREVKQTDTSTVGTVGKVSVSPNGTNVIPGEVQLGVDVRDSDEEQLSKTVEAIKSSTESITADRDLGYDWETRLEVPPKLMDSEIQSRLEEAADRCGIPCQPIYSGAGHDAMNAANVTPTGMIFIPSEGGISHSPNEFTNKDDLFAGVRVLEETLRSLTTV